MKTPRRDKKASSKDLLAYALMQERSNIGLLSEIRAIRHVLIDHLAQSMALQEMEAMEGATLEERERLEHRFAAEVEASLERAREQIRSSLMIQIEDVDPGLSAHIDDEAP
jgi:hypothetical protein